MKKIIQHSVFLIIFYSLTSGLTFSQPVNNCFPDVMNKVNVLNSSLKYQQTLFYELDSLTVFAGFPLVITGSTFEGGIFCNMDNDPELEIVFNVNYTVQALNINGTPVPGWPKTVSSYALEGAPAFGDIDGDGYGEIVVTNHGLTSGGFIYAYKRDGTPLPNFPINHGYSSRTPVLGDMDADGKLDIIVNKRTYPTGLVYVYKYDATIITGWPKTMGHVPASSAAVGDIDGDNVPEIVMESYTALYAWKSNGDSIPGFPYFMPNSDVNSYSSPVLADVDNDNIREIVFGTHVSGGGGYVYIMKNNGTVLSGWPKTTSNWIYGPPSVGYIDNDNIIDVAVGDQVLSGVPSDFVYAWNKNGVSLTGFPIGPVNAVNSQVVLADIDGDNNTELIFDDNSQPAGLGKYLVYNHDGTFNRNIETNGTTFFTTPCITDIDRNGILDIIGAGVAGTSPSQQTNVYLWNSGVAYSTIKTQTPMWQYNTKHNGVYNNGDLVSVTEVTVQTPNGYSLSQNYPNPFNPSTKISYSISKAGFVKISLYNILGKEVMNMVSEQKQAGVYEYTLNSNNLNTGVYYYKMDINGFTTTRKLLLIK
ncbi:MAG: T9SS type A sorting domain-containing protein [Candidatus Kapaibacterium sp.]